MFVLHGVYFVKICFVNIFSNEMKENNVAFINDKAIPKRKKIKYRYINTVSLIY